MTRPVNLYLLSRIPGKDAFNAVFHHAAEMGAAKQVPVHEIESLRALADHLCGCGVPAAAMDGFFLGYSIPQIGKEFDLLKFCDEGCLNIELKSQSVPLQQIRSQLRRSRHYLAHLGQPMELFTFVADTGQCFRLSEKDRLTPVQVSDLAEAVLRYDKPFLTEIDGLFKPSEYIVSPAGTPEKFLAREYFLTQAQDQVRKDLLEGLKQVSGHAFFSLTGKPGTGKTLLLYDVGRTLAERAQTAILHWGALSEGHRLINAAEIGLSILPWAGPETRPAGSVLSCEAEKAGPGGSDGSLADAADLDVDALSSYSYILVDESHRLQPAQFEVLCQAAKDRHQCVIFCLDPEQVLTSAERKNDIAGLIAALPLAGSVTLSERLRGNRELSAFIQQVRDLENRPPAHMDYHNVAIGYAADTAEAEQQLAYYRDLGYVFINYYKNAHNSSNPFAAFEGGYDIYHVIGQEFDRVVMLLDDSFCYTDDGKLEGVPRPDPDLLYPNVFYHGMTRVQEKLALIVFDNEPLFNRISEILKK